MLQKLIPGDGRQQFSYCAFFKDGQALGIMVAQRCRHHSPEFGHASTYVESIELPEFAEISTKFLRAIDYYGLVELEYKYDQREQTYKLLDVNARTCGYHSLETHIGVDFPAMLFADQLGQAVEPGTARRNMGSLVDRPTHCGARAVARATQLVLVLAHLAAFRCRGGL